jgi:hypothetical protein
VTVSGAIACAVLLLFYLSIVPAFLAALGLGPFNYFLALEDVALLLIYAAIELGRGGGNPSGV